MKPSRTQLLLLIALFFVMAAPLLAQTSAAPTTVAVAGDPANALPDAPNPTPRSATSYLSWAVRPTPMANGETVIDKQFVLMNGMMFGSGIANIELTSRCIWNNACQLVPDALRRRRYLYAVGLPADAGVTIVGYYLKRGGHRWWLVPAALVTAGQAVYAVHAARYMR